MAGARVRGWLILTFCLLAPGFCAAGGQQPASGKGDDALLEELRRTMGKAETVYAEFEQERYLALLDRPVRTRGCMLFRGPGSIRWETAGAQPAILICRGSTVTRFTWIDGRWRRSDAGPARGMRALTAGLALVLAGRFEDGGDGYAFSVHRGQEVVLTLRPRTRAAQRFLDSIEIHFSRDLARTRRVVLRQPGGDWTDIRILRQVIDAPLPDATFDPVAPVPIESVRRRFPRGDR